MAENLEAGVWEALKTIRYPGMSRDIVSFGFVRTVEVSGSTVTVELEMSTHNPEAAEQVRSEAETAVAAVAGVTAAAVRLHVQAPPSPGQRAIQRDPRLIPEVEHVVAVASGKGRESASRRSLPTSPYAWPSSAGEWGCSTPTSTDPRCRSCSASPSVRRSTVRA